MLQCVVVALCCSVLQCVALGGMTHMSHNL